MLYVHMTTYIARTIMTLPVLHTVPTLSFTVAAQCDQLTLRVSNCGYRCVSIIVGYHFGTCKQHEHVQSSISMYLASYLHGF